MKFAGEIARRPPFLTVTRPDTNNEDYA
jgi:hypothetical protein